MKNCENQIILFDLIQKETPNMALVDTVSDILNISNDASYRRIRGETLLSFEEAIKLCHEFQISIDSFANVNRKNKIQCDYVPLDLNNKADYFSYIKSISDIIETVRKAPESEIILSTVDVTLFNVFLYRELTSFQLFTWHKSMLGYAADFETFVKENDEQLIALYENIAKNYQLIPSTEIWTENTVDIFLRFLNFHYETGAFKGEKLPLLLCEQMLDLINNLHDWAEKGTKGSKEVPFQLYANETDIANTFVLFKMKEKTNCLIKLFTINGLNVSDEQFCRETENWLNNSIKRATLISGASERERFRFFNAKKQKIRHLIEKIQS